MTTWRKCMIKFWGYWIFFSSRLSTIITFTWWTRMLLYQKLVKFARLLCSFHWPACTRDSNNIRPWCVGTVLLWTVIGWHIFNFNILLYILIYLFSFQTPLLSISAIQPALTIPFIWYHHLPYHLTSLKLPHLPSNIPQTNPKYHHPLHWHWSPNYSKLCSQTPLQLLHLLI